MGLRLPLLIDFPWVEIDFFTARNNIEVGGALHNVPRSHDLIAISQNFRSPEGSLPGNPRIDHNILCRLNACFVLPVAIFAETPPVPNHGCFPVRLHLLVHFVHKVHKNIARIFVPHLLRGLDQLLAGIFIVIVLVFIPPNVEIRPVEKRNPLVQQSLDPRPHLPAGNIQRPALVVLRIPRSIFPPHRRAFKTKIGIVVRNGFCVGGEVYFGNHHNVVFRRIVLDSPNVLLAVRLFCRQSGKQVAF